MDIPSWIKSSMYRICSQKQMVKKSWRLAHWLRSNKDNPAQPVLQGTEMKRLHKLVVDVTRAAHGLVMLLRQLG